MRSAHAAETGGSGFASSAKLGLWWFLASEIMVFGGVVASYFLLRLAGPGWGDDIAHNSTLLGTINTIVLLTSSFTMVEVHAAWNRRDADAFRRFLGLTIVLGLVFLVIKGFEYGAHFREAIFPAKSLFWAFYYGMTGLHALHVLAGIIANVSLLVVAWRPEGLMRFGHRAEMNGLYWHFVDVVWIILFPLLYLG
ncbi:MAG: cytochrome c oxidase subunit 3 [bacterium]|nr:cytochrome c oxidase subunit 3 [bacterium]